MSISAGQPFGSYEVIEPIGAGGMGEVWRAHDTALKRDVAVKVLDFGISKSIDPQTISGSPDGESLACRSPTDRQLMRVSVAGRSPVPITSVAAAPMTPSWNADDRILFAHPGRILGVSANGSEESSVVVETNGLAAGPVLLHGTLVYIEGQSAGGGQHLALAIGDSDGNVEPLDVPEKDYAYPSVSPDGKRVAVEIRGDGGDSEIYLYDLSGTSEMRALTSSDGVNSQPSWKDERTVVFASDRDGRQRIYQQSIDGGGATVLTDPEAGDGHNFPVVTPDDKLLVTTGSAILLQPINGVPEPLLNHATARAAGSFSPDGSELAYRDCRGGSPASSSCPIRRMPPACRRRPMVK